MTEHTPEYLEGRDRGRKEWCRIKPIPKNPYEEGTDQYKGWEDEFDYMNDIALAGDYGY